MAFVGSLSGSGGASNTINVTGSMIIANPGTGGLFPDFPGSDTVFFVSGAIDGKTAGSRTVAVFGGDTVVSGSLTVGTGSVKLTSNDIQFSSFGTRIERNGNNLTFFDASNAGGLTLSQLNTGGGGGGSNFFTETSNGVIYNSGTVAFTGARTDLTSITAASDKGTDVVFYFSGSTAGDATTLFGGNVVTSGSISTGGNIEVKGGNITTNQATFNLLNSVTTLNVGTSATTVNIGQASNAINVAGNLDVNGTSDLAGAVTLSGNSQTVTHTGTSGNLTISSNNGDVLVEGTTFSGNNVTIPGNLTVNGTTTTVNTDNLVVRDKLIYIASSSTAGTVGYGGIAIASGSGTTDQALVFVKDGTGTDAVWSAGRQDVNSGSETTNAGLSYLPIRASSFQMGGTVGSAVAVGSSYVSSSDGLNTLINHTTSTTFTKSGTGVVQITNFPTSDEGLITGNSTVNNQTLWLSGSSLALAHSNAGNAGPNGSRIRLIGLDGSNANEGGYVKVAGTIGNSTLTVGASSNSGSPQAMVLTGSKVTIGANTAGLSNGIQLTAPNAGTPTTFATFYLNGTTATGLFSQNGTELSSLGSSSTADFSITGSNVNLKHGATGKITLQRGNSSYGEIQYVIDGSRGYTQFNSANIGTNVRIGTSNSGPNTGNINLSGSVVEVLAENGAQFQTLGTATTYLTVQSGSYVTPAGTALNFAKIEAGLNNNLLVGSAGNTSVSGSQVRLNVVGTNPIAMQSHGSGFLTFASASTNAVTIAVPTATTANVINDVATTVNAFGAATTLSIANTATTAQTVNLGASSTGASTYNLATGATGTGITKAINLGTGGAAGSTTNITLGSGNGGTTAVKDNLTVDGNTTLGSDANTDTITFTARAASNLVPTSNYTYDLGSVDLRWKNIYTGDLHLKNDRGNWTIVEEAECLTITNNLNGKRYKFVLEEL
jgi:hypothetical protein